MYPWVTSPSFVVEKPAPVSPWTVQPSPAVTIEKIEPYQSDENLKKQFGIELAKSTNAFEAACRIFKEDETNKALWISFHWLTDPLVISTRDVYLKNLELSAAPLDREQLAAKVLKLAEGEKIERGGVLLPTIEAKDRIAAFKLYSDILGYTGKVEVDNSITNNTINEISVKLVRPGQEKPVVVIDNAPNVKSEIVENKSPIVLKMVSAR